jgi:tetratricopeptide (TPR) repeat protein
VKASRARPGAAIRGPLRRWSLTGAAVLASLALGGCLASRGAAPDWGAAPAPPGPEQRERQLILAAARAELQRDNGPSAQHILAPLLEAEPGDFATARLYQDAQCLGASEGELRQLLRQSRERAAREGNDFVALLLAARLEPQPEVARTWLERAAAVRPNEVWVSYAFAHLEASRGDWARAASHLKRALELEPAHAPSRRMEAALLARRGQRQQAIAALERWLERTAEDPLIGADDRAEAALDLAQLLIQEQRLSRARAVLSKVDRRGTSRARALTCEAALLQADGQSARALERSREAQAADPLDPLPVVQEALLYENEMGDPRAALAAWQRVLLLSQRGQLGDLLLGLQAQVSIERYQSKSPALP